MLGYTDKRKEYSGSLFDSRCWIEMFGQCGRQSLYAYVKGVNFGRQENASDVHCTVFNCRTIKCRAVVGHIPQRNPGYLTFSGCLFCVLDHYRKGSFSPDTATQRNATRRVTLNAVRCVALQCDIRCERTLTFVNTTPASFCLTCMHM